MHLLVPFASDTSEACRHVLGDLALPNLARLLARLEAVARDDGDVRRFSPPHERALAAARGWAGGDGALPFAAQAAALDGIDVRGGAWGLVTPAHWQLGRDHAAMADPASIGLGIDESKALFAAVAPLFESEGFVTAWGAADRWYLGASELQGFATASLDRVIGRNVDPWLGETASPLGRRVRRLQSEAQLVLHQHPVNEAREERGDAAINSFWLSGCGALPAAVDAGREPTVEPGLRRPLLGADWAAWAEAWQALDAGPIARAAESDTPPALTLCGERSAARFEPRPRGWMQRLRSRWSGVDVRVVLEGL